MENILEQLGLIFFAILMAWRFLPIVFHDGKIIMDIKAFLVILTAGVLIFFSLKHFKLNIDSKKLEEIETPKTQKSDEIKDMPSKKKNDRSTDLNSTSIRENLLKERSKKPDYIPYDERKKVNNNVVRKKKNEDLFK